MFFPEGRIRVFLYGQPTDMRKSFDGLQALTRHAMGRDPLDGSLYVFVNRRGAQMRVLYFDRSGFCVWAKRLEAGRFIGDWRNVRTGEMNCTQLKVVWGRVVIIMAIIPSQHKKVCRPIRVRFGENSIV